MDVLLGSAVEYATEGAKFTADRCERVLVDGEHLLRTLGAPDVADQVEEMRREFRRVRFEDDQRRLQRAAERELDVRISAGGLPAWRDVVTPHDDVAKGTFQLAQFAADLRLVHQGKAGAEYGDPAEFFERTFLTRGLRDLLKQAVLRMSGRGGDPIVDLMTTFGGGKTHSLLGVYHACSGISPDRLDGLRELCAEAGVDALPDQVNRVVLVGNDLSVLGSAKSDGTRVNTMWGEIAWQLGGRVAYDMVAEYDRASSPPPTTTLENLLNAFSPCVILIDEWVAYFRQLWSSGGDGPALPAGTFDGHLTFVQSLTEATKNAPRAFLVVSLPASDSVRDMGDGIIDNAHEVGGTPGLEALRGLRSVIHRVETPWQPATMEESYKIVRRRLFKPFGVEQVAARNMVVTKFREFYHRYPSEVPTEVREYGYETTMRDAYPIHPELFTRLYEDWSTLERFQRTRGVLRLMATVVHALWTRGDTSAMILPASVPLDDQKVVEELASHLDDKWGPVIQTDLAGDGSTAAGVDRDIPLLGRTMAAQRAARCVFLGSVPSANRRDKDGRIAVNRGIEQKRVVLGATYPGDNPAHVADALRQIADRGSYIDRDDDRYSLSLSQNLAQLARSRADGYHDDDIDDTLMAVLREEKDKGVFQRVHRMPATSADVDDEPTAALVVFGPNRAFRKAGAGKPVSDGEKAAIEFIQRRGTNARIHKNALVFAAPDADRCDTMLRAVRAWKAWKSVVDTADDLNLTPVATRGARQRLDQARQTMQATIKEAYRWILNPSQEPGDAAICIDAILMNGNGTLAERVTRKAEQSELVYTSYTVSFLRRWIDRLDLWSNEPHIALGKLAGYFTQYVYMPRIVAHDVLHTTILTRPDTVLITDNEGIAYADYIDGDGRYIGLTLSSTGHVQASGLVVDPKVANRQIEADHEKAEQAKAEREEKRRTATVVPDDGNKAGSGESIETVAQDHSEKTGGGEIGAQSPSTRVHRMYATTALNPSRIIRDVSRINEEIVSHFTNAGLRISIHIEISSDDLANLDPAIVTALKENLATMSFADWNME
ncbi:DUF499 domain-containing protein [Nonomuraea sp. NPDC048892]|uniref:ATP-binding protein n=1 Tax=Nonomuraea sp. NPDC048892 TaxID=3154624 RepID=UPI0033D73365